MFCFAPVLLLGYAMTIITPTHHTSSVDGVVVEAQTCESGLGLHVKASTAGLFGLGVQYGATLTQGDWTATFQPYVGLSSTSEARRELPSTHQFEVGATALFGYKHHRIGVSYWHLSNAGMQQPNIGLDMIVVMTGWQF